jgi:DNA-binding IclR family transcriptional regulator
MSVDGQRRGDRPDSQSSSLTFDKGLSILDCFDVAHPEWTFKAICARTGIPRATAHRLIRTLEDRNYLAHNQRAGTYHLGSSMLRSAYLTLSHSELVRVAHPHLEELAGATVESAILTVRTDQGPLIVDAVLTSRPFKPEVVVGSIMEGVTSAHSRIFLAFPEHGEKGDPALARELQVAASAGIDAEELARVRSERVAYDLGEWSPAKSAIGAPVFDSSGQVKASLAIIYPSERWGVGEMEKLSAVLKEAAARLSSELGYRTEASG